MVEIFKVKNNSCTVLVWKFVVETQAYELIVQIAGISNSFNLFESSINHESMELIQQSQTYFVIALFFKTCFQTIFNLHGKKTSDVIVYTIGFLLT